MLYIMRHGKTDWNALHRLQGRTNVPLNEEGIAMAKRAREEYMDVHFDVCYCSPLDRAKETARLLLAGRDVPIIEDERLLEMCFGVYEGLPYSFEDDSLPVSVIFKTPELYREPLDGAESFEELFKRTGDFLANVVNPGLADGKDILIVGHGAMNSSIICQVKNIPIKDFWSTGIENCRLIPLTEK